MRREAQYRIRKGRPADAAAILELEKMFPSDRMSPRSVRNFLKAPTAQVWMAVASHASRLTSRVSRTTPHEKAAGCLILLTRRNGRYARIYSVAVSPAQRGRGLGMRLVETAERWARSRGLSGMFLEVRLDNAPARALYAKRGYREVARLPGFYDDGAPGLRLLRSFTTVEPGRKRV